MKQRVIARNFTKELNHQSGFIPSFFHGTFPVNDCGLKILREVHLTKPKVLVHCQPFFFILEEMKVEEREVS